MESTGIHTVFSDSVVKVKLRSDVQVLRSIHVQSCFPIDFIGYTVLKLSCFGCRSPKVSYGLALRKRDVELMAGNDDPTQARML
jgi:hypothetical protein